MPNNQFPPDCCCCCCCCRPLDLSVQLAFWSIVVTQVVRSKGHISCTHRSIWADVTWPVSDITGLRRRAEKRDPRGFLSAVGKHTRKSNNISSSQLFRRLLHVAIFHFFDVWHFGPSPKFLVSATHGLVGTRGVGCWLAFGVKYQEHITVSIIKVYRTSFDLLLNLSSE